MRFGLAAKPAGMARMGPVEAFKYKQRTDRLVSGGRKRVICGIRSGCKGV